MAENLVLEVIDGPTEANMRGHTKTFARAGGSIGRADSNNWILPDMERIISSVHADILYADNSYYLVDKSTNGTFLNGVDKPVGSGKKVKINDGDIIGVGLFQLKAVLEASKADLPDGLGSVDFLDASDKTTIGSMAAQAVVPVSDDNDQLDQWLEPGKSVSHQDIWGRVDPGADLAASPADPLASLSGTGNLDPLGSPSNRDVLDPLEALSGAGQSQIQGDISSSWGGEQSASASEDQWWVGEADNVPAVQQSISIPRPAQPVAPVQPESRLVQPPVPPSLDDMSLDQLLTPGEHAPVGGVFAETVSVTEPAISQQPQFQSQPVQQSQPVFAPVMEPVAPELVPQVAAQPLQQPPTQTIPQAATQTATQPAPESVESLLMSQLGLASLAPSDLASLDVEAAAFIRETVSRLMDLLRARSTIKNELRVERTMIQSQDNNPLKFSASVDDALTMMFGKNSDAFLSPEAAIRDSFDNVSDHQIAVLAAMRGAYESMMAQFAPDNLENLLSRINTRGFSVNKKAKKWSAYQEWFGQLTKDPESAYNRLFGEVFTDAYEKKISELNAIRNLK